MQAEIDTITVRAAASDDVQADKADLLVTIKGSSLITGSTALKKAREVRQLVADLAPIGIAESAITLLSVTAETTTHVIGKTSSARYNLCIRCRQLDDLADVLGIITGQKNTQLTAIMWDYPDLAPIHDRLLAQSLRRCAAKATLMAEALASRVDRVHAVTETTTDQEGDLQPHYARAASLETSRARLSSDDLGLAVTHTKRIGVHVEVVYHLQPVSATAVPI
jgi:uncharacterized protein YggE